MYEFFKFITPYLKRHKRWFIIVNLLAFVTAICEVAIPIQISYLLDDIILTQLRDKLFLGVLGLIGFIALDFVANSSLRLATSQIGQTILKDIRQDLYITLQGQELPFYAEESPGQILSRTIGEMMAITNLLQWGYRLASLFTWMLVLSVIYMGRISPYLAITFVLIFPIMILVIIGVSKETQGKFYNERFVRGELNEFTTENLAGIKTVKSFGREFEQIEEYRNRFHRYIHAALQTFKIRVKVTEGMIFLLTFLIMGLIFIGGAFIHQGIITPGEFAAFMLLVSQISVPGRWVGLMGIMLHEANAATIRLNEVFQAPNLISTSQGTNHLTNIRGEIAFENVSFQINGHQKILDNINLHIPAGSKLLILGPNGGGKSTLVNLLSRFYIPQEGRILIDNQELGALTLHSIRENIGFVHQEAFLFTLSIHDNIAYGMPNATREQVIEVAKIAQIHDFIDSLENKYDTVIGERGVTLSGGQRQRMAIARTLLKNPAILVFDDSVSAIDPETEALIQETLMANAKARTTIIISQRSSSIKYADKIIVMDEGRIQQEGTDPDLRAKEGIYRDFINAIEGQNNYLDWTQSSPETPEEMKEEKQHLEDDAVEHEITIPSQKSRSSTL